ncbi:MAG: ShlB/FhaC/HecB family hemolysin secretion/activation protein [Chloroflexaceae bacterium]|nr:ShlB/FhaC/HecB family hemolysin secretion/activation protein [Chloroflexaceae bacterium]
MASRVAQAGPEGVESFVVKAVAVAGSSVFGTETFAPIIEPLEGRTVTLTELQGAADKITQLYLNEGYLTSRAVLVRDSLGTETVTIQVLEGGLESIEIEGARRLGTYVRSRIALGTGTPLNVGSLEDQLRLLRSDPLIENVEASLRAGTGVGQSVLVVRVDEANPLAASIGADNYSPPSVGGERLLVNLAYRNLTGLGDEVFVSYRPRFADFVGTYTVEAGYEVPINPKNGTLAFRATIDRNEVISGQFEALEISGESELYEFTYRQPLIRSFREELALSWGFSYRTGQTFTLFGPTPFGFGPDEDGVSETSVFRFAQEYVRRDRAGAWALRSQFRLGTDILGATDNADPIPDSEFFAWLGQLQRVQVINDDNFLIIQLDMQFTPDALLPSEQFAIGGGQSVRGYRQNVLSGDNGVRFSVEDRITVLRNEAGNATIQLAPFLDVGGVFNSNNNPNTIVLDQRAIVALGLGLLLQPVEGLNIRLDYAPPLVDLNIEDDNIQDSGFYFSTTYSF